MPRTRVVAGREVQRKKIEQEEKLRLAQMRAEAALEKADEFEKRAKHQVDMQMKLIHARTDKRLLEMKWSEFVNLNPKHFKDYKWKVPEPPVSRVRSTSISSDRGRCRTPQLSQLPRPIVHSLDRGHLKTLATPQKAPPMSFERWPRAGELVLSCGGSPLAVQTPQQNCADVHIPTKKGVITVKPFKIERVTRDVLMQLDANTLNQVKTLKANLGVIVDMANKMGKM
ncbi:borealin [Drosophila guanche]|uniref:Blast:Borealin n=1 Tax=Drosophila guanche TaxID=7266 RepID=A0A3B0JUU8_DROGU|nr:borealin [Drosophila guanche]SPP85864.1 blast:Borealin [Drosophila guanche]